MKIIGFNFTKINAEKPQDLIKQVSINTDVIFKDIQRQDLEFLKDLEGIKVSFIYTLNFSEHDEKKEDKKKKTKESESKIIFEGIIVLSALKEDAEEILSQWKKKELKDQFKVPLFNFILKKCTSKALQLEDELGLPTHIPIPKIRSQ